MKQKLSSVLWSFALCILCLLMAALLTFTP